MPVTIGWIFATGRNHPLWTVSFDMTQMPANAVSADTRAPYGDMNFDGTAGEGADGDVAGGVGWGDRYKFRSTSAPFTLNSGWTWNTPNTIPHNMLWTQNIDSEMGIVLTQPIAQQDAGGYFGVNQWMKTSANGSLCANPISVMPCDFTWPFQSINYSFGGNANATTQSKRLAWGADFGYIGQTNYPDRATGANRSGYPYQSYSTYIVLDQHSRAPTDTQVTQMEARQLGSVAATVGMVAANGPAGLGRVDTIAYSPNGFDPVFDAWTFTAGASNNLTASFTIAAPAQLNNPLIIVRGYNLATEPFQVKVAGITRTADVDYYASAVPSRNELWLTLRGQYQNTTSLEITGASPLVSYTVTATAGTNGSISPAARTVASGATTTFTVTANAGYAAAVNGCGGALNAGVYTTAAVVADCAVTASFTVLPTTLAAVQSRKTHGAAGTFDLRLDQAFTVEPRTIGAGHLIVFQFSQPVTITGTVTATNGMVTATSVNSEVRVTLTGIADNARTTISLSGVNGNVAAAVLLGFLVGDVNNSQAVKASDISGVKARVAQAQPLTTANFQYDLNTDGSLTSADISAVKGRAGQVLQ